MKTRASVLILVILLAVAPTFAAKVAVDYDRDYTKKVETFQWKDPEKGETNSLMHQRVVNAIKHELTNRGLVEVQSSPDIQVTYYSSSKEQVNFNTTSVGYGYPRGWYGGYGGYYGGMGTSTTTVSTWEIGTLVIDAWDAESQKLIWRGTAEATVSSNPQKNEKKINKAVQKIFRKWDSIRKKNAKKKK